ncbi:hypothetical protein DPMN_116237 [Dreissena polymorpha]|uniref:Uncharacterized protein n=1 Tax=Dreissena polymorpha TaxID=45954 RepID=A0A9D4KNG7_DREPO|nr:hypothetical protein DPMN_116237 [Dreissena polymorpha]
MTGLKPPSALYELTSALTTTTRQNLLNPSIPLTSPKTQLLEQQWGAFLPMTLT